MPAHRLPGRREIQDRICRTLEGGGTLAALLDEPGFPCRRTIGNWARAEPAFAERMAEARRVAAARLAAAGGRLPFDAARAEALLVRVRRGETLPAAMRAEGLHRRALNRWKAEHPGFARALAEAKRFAERGRHLPRAYDAAAADRVVARMHAGERMPKIREDSSAPGVRVLRRWRRADPTLDQALTLARRGGFRRRGQRQTGCTAELTERIVAAIRQGGSLHSVSQTPGLPHYETLYRWMRTRPEFRATVLEACRQRDDYLADRALTIAEAATPQTLVVDRLRVRAIKRFVAGSRWWWGGR